MSRRIILAIGLIALACGLALAPPDVQGCAAGFRDGERVDVADEAALIVWDDSTKTEHFIRRANFVGNAYDFALLVPTPNKPRIERADPDLFTELAKITEPKTEYRTVSQLDFGCSAAALPAKSDVDPKGSGNIIVLEQKKVGNLDSATLAFRGDKSKATEEVADELLSWLNRNGYAVRSDLKNWLRPYIDNTWIITAFRVAGETGPDQPKTPPKDTALKAAAVRMTFNTDQPLFPYREPADQSKGAAASLPRLLRVYVAARYRMAGKIGDGTTNWPGQTVWSNSITDPERLSILGKARLHSSVMPGRWRLTEFEDRSSPRQAIDDLYFTKADDQAAVARPPIIIIKHSTPWWVWAGAVIVPAGFGGIIVLFRRSMRKHADAALGERIQKVEPKGPKPEEKGQKTDPRRWF